MTEALERRNAEALAQALGNPTNDGVGREHHE